MHHRSLDVANSTPAMERLKQHSNPIINEYLQRGFGTMTKNDFEVMILHELLQSELKGKSNYEISQALRIPESKVKRLVYEVNLRYETEDSVYLENFIDCLLGAQEMRDGNKIKFIIEDVATRRYLDSVLKSKHLYSDTSWNTEIVVITPKSLASVLEKLLTSKEADMVRNRIELAKAELKKERILKGLEDLLLGLTRGGVENAASIFVDLFGNK